MTSAKHGRLSCRVALNHHFRKRWVLPVQNQHKLFLILAWIFRHYYQKENFKDFM